MDFDDLLPPFSAQPSFRPVNASHWRPPCHFHFACPAILALDRERQDLHAPMIPFL
jgi:hypothetical protein